MITAIDEFIFSDRNDYTVYVEIKFLLESNEATARGISRPLEDTMEIDVTLNFIRLSVHCDVFFVMYLGSFTCSWTQSRTHI